MNDELTVWTGAIVPLSTGTPESSVGNGVSKAHAYRLPPCSSNLDQGSTID
jgi:hypothetical protein